MTTSTSPLLGIDLGTTNSVVAAIVDGKPRVLAEEGESILPSVVGLDAEGKLITGTIARNQLAAYPDRTVASIKRRMGSMEPVTLGDQTFTPPEISAMILRRLRDRASRQLGQPVDRAVITVPAFFDDAQRQATLEAGDLAGLKVERIINEPTAATLVYHAGEQDRKQILVYDLGGGTFDVSIVRMEAGVVEVLCSKGDTHLGGDDFDQLLMEHVAAAFEEEHGIDLREAPGTRYRLLKACEQAKIDLSSRESVEIAEEFIAEKEGQPLNLRFSITRGEYEELITPLVTRTIDCVDDALREAQLTIHQLDDLVLVGGSTRTPLVEQLLRDEFLREPSRAVDPDLAVALGAAVQAAMIAGESAGPVLVDVTGHTLGVEADVSDNPFTTRLRFSPMIHRNTPLPARYEQAYFTKYDDQKKVVIHVLQGEHEEVERNRSLGEFTLDLESGGDARSKILVTFDLTLDGTLNVTAKQNVTGNQEQLVISNALSQFQAEERSRAEARLGAMFDASEELLEDEDLPQSWPEDSSSDEPDLDSSSMARQYPQAFELLEKAEKMKVSVDAEDAEDLETFSRELKQAIAAQDELAIAKYTAELDDVLFYVQ